MTKRIPFPVGIVTIRQKKKVYATHKVGRVVPSIGQYNKLNPGKSKGLHLFPPKVSKSWFSKRPSHNVVDSSLPRRHREQSPLHQKKKSPPPDSATCLTRQHWSPFIVTNQPPAPQSHDVAKHTCPRACTRHKVQYLTVHHHKALPISHDLASSHDKHPTNYPA